MRAVVETGSLNAYGFDWFCRGPIPSGADQSGPVLDRSTSITVEWPQPQRTELLCDLCRHHSNKARHKLLTNPEKPSQQHSAISKQLDVSQSTGIP